MLQNKGFLGVAALLCCLSQTVLADVKVTMGMVAQTGVGKSIGNVLFTQTPYGLLITPALTNLSPGLHGFHVHQAPSCDNFGQAAQGHLDPKNTGKHLGPYSEAGHLGDLPALYVDKNGNANLPVLAPRLKLNDIMGHSLMIHAGGDNYSDQPKMGGGGDRIVCGIIPIEVPNTVQPANANVAETNAAPLAAAPQQATPTNDATTAPVQPQTNNQSPSSSQHADAGSVLERNKFVELRLPAEHEAAI